MQSRLSLISLPREIAILTANYLDVRSYLRLRETCRDFMQLDVDEYWLNVMKNELKGEVHLLKLNEGVTWKDVVMKLWKEIKIDWFDVISDPYFYKVASFLHTNGVNDEVFEGEKTRSSIKLLMDYEAYLSGCEDHELTEELFDSTSDVYTFMTNMSSFTFSLPGNNRLRFCITAEGLYFFLNDIDIGRIDGHHCMPALRWKECKQIADYQIISPPFTYDFILIFLSLLAYPTEEDIEEYRMLVGNAFLATGMITSEEKLALWRDSLEACDNWTYDEELQAWVHRWGARNSHNATRLRAAQDILSQLDSPPPSP